MFTVYIQYDLLGSKNKLQLDALGTYTDSPKIGMQSHNAENLEIENAYRYEISRVEES